MLDRPRSRRTSRGRIALLAIGCVLTASCSLFVDLEGYAGSAPEPADASFESSATAGDAARDSNPVPDASAADSPIADSPVADSPNDASAAACDGGAAPQSDSGVDLAPPTASSPPFGGDGGSPFDETCPSGTALVGFNLVAADVSPYSLRQIQGLCAPIVREPCAVTVGQPTPLTNIGSASGTAGTLMCPAGNVLVGLRTMSGLFVDSVTLDCAPLTSTTATGPLSRGAITSVGPFGGNGGSLDQPFDCPTPMVANEVAGRSGTFIDQMQIGCATPIVP